ncbi:receptor-like protein 54 isoform X2 [Humulus lupulus]|uniref:receptor-like protein 54 isoform X2 n=1 Tax=Humulus lupulus TaxID=3486 RepID=UPI002B40E8AE|nr:receptor-like protein 54 isoform X2 [Humulus lupulus]
MRIHQFSWLFFIPFCLILLGVDLDAVSGQCLSDQKSLLLQLKDNLIFNANKSTKLVTWSQNSDCSAWKGVTLDSEGRVTGLSLSNERISDGIPNSSLFRLQHLKSLDLSLNNFNSTIPDEIGNLSTLRYLNLSNAGFVGQVPITISHLTNLVTLDISTLLLLSISSLKLENPDLGMLVQNLSKLEELYLDGVNISAPGTEWCKALASSVRKVRVLSLSNCHLSGPLDESLENLHSLSVIRLNDNNLSAMVPQWFADFSNLTSLALVSCGLFGNFPEKIFQVATLQNIVLAGNPYLQGFLPEFPQNNSLQRLVLSSSNFSGQLPTSIGNLWNLSRLDLSNCNFSRELPNSMGKLSQLVYLDLSFNKLTGPIPSFNLAKNLTQINLSYNMITGEIPSTHWEGLLKLVNIDLSSNNLEGQLPKSIFELGRLKILLLSSNKFNGTMQFDVIQKLRNLTSLDLSYNKLSVNVSGKNSTMLSFPQITTLKLASCELTTFPDLKKQSNLVYLDLSDNQLHEEIPNWIWKLGNGNLLHLNLSYNQLMSLQEPYTPPTSLSVLDLHFNQLHGKIPRLPPACTYIDFSSNNFTSSIPTDIGNHLNITIFLSVSNNNLTGIVPKSICNAAYLQVLDLSYNNLSSEIPKCLSVMSQTLGVLNIRENNFTGSIPDAFPFNCSLETLDLNGNSIEGKIPDSLFSCTRLEVLDLGNNNMSGDFPCRLKNISTLRVLVLRSNRFKGHIGCQNFSGNWVNLQIVDLAHNNFSGNLSGQCLKRWKAMLADDSMLKHLRFEFLEFSASRYYQDAVTVTFKGLEMKVQKILTVFTSIDLSCNHLVGSIPEQVGQLRGLYFLNLSNNALTGTIPSTIGDLQQLESLDLSNNNLNGLIPSSLASLTFLSLLNLSFNDLTGRIPLGTQIQTFPPNSFIGNKALCGIPLNNCPSRNAEDTVLSVVRSTEFEWQSIYAGIGFGVGGGVVFALLMFWDEGKTWLEDSIDKILLVILPMMGYTYKARHEWDDEDEEDAEYLGSDFDEDPEEDEMELKESQGPYCVFCSKLDISRKMVIHDPGCTCHSPPISSSSSFSSSSSSGST